MMAYKTIGPTCVLGEGPLWHPQIMQLFWFDIPNCRLYACDELGAATGEWSFDEPASAAGWVDDKTLLVATASGLNKFNISWGQLTPIVKIEATNPLTRSNDGRTGPDGSFWIGTMALDQTIGAGAYYRHTQGGLNQLFDKVSIPNATCFSPDGGTAYLSDTRKRIIWRWPLDKSGAPIGDREVHIDLRDQGLNPDGAVCDSEGYLWNAQWGASRLARYAPDGSLERVVELPVSQPTCPAFGGKDLKTLFVTSATEGLSQKELDKNPESGKIIFFSSEVSGMPEHPAKFWPTST